MDDVEKKLVSDYPLFFMQMNEAQRAFIRSKNIHKKLPLRRLFEAGNKVGKTEIGIAEDIAHAIGCRVWLEEDDPDYKIDIPIPNNGLIGCETMAHSVPEKIEPTLKRLLPKTSKWKMKKNPQGQIQNVTIETDPFGKECGSTFHIRSYDQEPSTFEGIDYHWIHWDEPPPKQILQAAERGKVAYNAPSWFTMTPLKEAYIYDEYSLKAGNNGGDDHNIAVIRGEIWDNCRDWCQKCGLDVPENRLWRKTPWCPRCKRALGFIAKSGIDEYLKTLDPEEREAREKGIWKHLSGLVYKILDRDFHVYDDFQIPTHWEKIEGIDPHDAKPTYYLFGAVSPEEIEIFGKLRNRIYYFDYLVIKDSLDELVRKVKMKREQHGYTKPKFISLDAKYGIREQLESRTWEQELNARSLGYIKLSKSRPGDVELGHKIVREYLKTHYSVINGTAKPGIMFARRGCGGEGGPINQMFNYQYKPERDDPDPKFKDFPDVVRYNAMEEPVYRGVDEKQKMFEIIKERQERVYSTRRNIERGTAMGVM